MVVLALLLSCTRVGQAQNPVPAPHEVWQLLLGGNPYWHISETMIGPAEKAGDLRIMGTTAPPRGESGAAKKLWLWRVSSTGEKLREAELQGFPEDQVISASYVKILSILDNGDLLLVTECAPDVPLLVRIDQTSKVVWTKKLEHLRRLVVFKVVPTIDRKFLLLGQRSSKAFIAKIDGAGEILWDKTFDPTQKWEWFLDGTPTEDGGAVVVGNTNFADRVYMEIDATTVWIVKLDREGNIQAEQNFPGRHGSIARSQSGNYGLVYDQGKTHDQDIWLQAVDRDLKLLWRTPMFAINFGLSGPKIAASPDGGFVVAASRQHRLWLSQVDQDGKKLWEFEEKGKAGKPVISELNFTPEALFILVSATSQDAAKTGILKFVMPEQPK